MDRRGRRERLRPARGVRRGRARRPDGARLRAVRRSAPCVADRHRGTRPGRPRLEGVQRRAQAARRRPRRRPGQADRQDLPAGPPRLGHPRGDPRRDRARSRSSRSRRAAGPAGRGGRRGPGRAPLESMGARPTPAAAGRGCVRILVAEPIAAGGRRTPPGRSTRSTNVRALARRAVRDHRRDYDALIVRSQVQVDAELIAAGKRLAVIGRAASAWTTSTSTRPRAPGSSSSTLRPATPSRRPSTPSRCSTASPAGSPPADASLRRGEWKRAAVHRPRAARPDARHHRARQDRPGHRGPGPGDGDDRRSASTRSSPRRRPPITASSSSPSTTCSTGPTSSPSTSR